MTAEELRRVRNRVGWSTVFLAAMTAIAGVLTLASEPAAGDAPVMILMGWATVGLGALWAKLDGEIAERGERR